MIYYKELSDRIIKSAIEGHKTLGNGFLEKVYENSMLHEMDLEKISAQNQVPVPVYFKGKIVGDYYADIVESSLN